MMSTPLLQIEDLHVQFCTQQGTVHAVRGVSLAVERGEVVGLVGETGCGKSATGLSILRMIPSPGQVVRGRVLFKGENLLEKSIEEMRRIRGRHIAMVFQDPSASLNPVLTVEEQMIPILKEHLRLSGNKARARVFELLSSVGLPNPRAIARSYPHQLSGGMQQRVMIAMALSADPELLIADEPTTALDVTIQAQILELLLELQQARGISILLITHNLGIVAETCGRVAVLYAGQVVEQGGVHDLFLRPMHPYTQGLLAALPRPGEAEQPLQVIPGRVPDGMQELIGCSFAPRCSYVMNRCVQTMPAMVAVASRHTAACFLIEESSHA